MTSHSFDYADHLAQARAKASVLAARKGAGIPVAMFTAYDYPTAKILAEAGADVLLVGDSLGMVIMGYPDTTHVTLQDMIHHTRMVARAETGLLVIADMPIHTYDTVEDTLTHARLLMEAGADAVKLEGGRTQYAKLVALREAGIPTIGHIGLLPQSVLVEGGYKIKGKSAEEIERLRDDVLAVCDAGVSLVIIEGTVAGVARELTALSTVPTIGIGSGSATCDGAVVVIADLVGAYPWFVPSFVKPVADQAGLVRDAARSWIKTLRCTEEQI